ncbi:3-hydroxybutyryl-CoA dehydrogenase [Protofrankia sp. BMG5.30]|nr:3-hydroxybutyryl-CoA dehydrogenase [Protofrankia sp. BMG5.30]
MGVGIAYVFAAADCEVFVVEPDPGRARGCVETVRAQSRQGLARGRLTAEQAAAIPGRVTAVDRVRDLPRALDLVVESVPERLELKHEVLAAAAERGPAVLASNTSSLSIDALAARLPDPATFLGMHFFNPVWSLRMVEIVRGSRTSEDTLRHAGTLVTRLGKQAIVVRDVPGFATSRLDLVASLEAMRMLEDGVASAADIDTAMVVAYRHPMGPLRLSDVVGLDVRLDIARQLCSVYGERFAPPAVLVEKVAAGKLGRKSGEGFYRWPDEPAAGDTRSILVAG